MKLSVIVWHYDNGTEEQVAVFDSYDKARTFSLSLLRGTEGFRMACQETPEASEDEVLDELVEWGHNPEGFTPQVAIYDVALNDEWWNLVEV